MTLKTVSLGNLIVAQRRLILAGSTFPPDVIAIAVDEHGYLSVEEHRSVFERAGMMAQLWGIKKAVETINDALHAHPELSWKADDGFALTVDPGEGESWRLVQRPAPEAA